MSTTPDPHASDAMVGPHASPDDHGGDHGHDDHAHADEPLGPIDVPAWGAGALGIAAGLAVAVVMALSTGWLG
ncbi:MAG: hypothetical protein AB1736_11220 [Chloroflexota bacterium]